MVCKHPISIKYQTRIIQVPCGRCIACRVSKAQLWTDRIKAEIILHDNLFSFVTLTYDDEHVPHSPKGLMTLSKDDFTNFMKRFRYYLFEYLEKKLSFKYFACGEYGEKYGRPHYHLLIIGIHSNAGLKTVLHKAWPYGFVDCQPPLQDTASVSYCTSYITKKLTGSLAQEVYEDAQPPFQRSSKSIGLGFYTNNIDQIDRKELRFGKRPVKVPRCWIDKFPHLKGERLKFFIDHQLSPTSSTAQEDYFTAKVAYQRALDKETLAKYKVGNL